MSLIEVGSMVQDDEMLKIAMQFQSEKLILYIGTQI